MQKSENIEHQNTKYVAFWSWGYAKTREIGKHVIKKECIYRF